jgi:phosphosulfolactate phosphohydrolase-like enzyme
VAADIADSPSGRELIEAGFAEDVALAAAIDVSRTVPLLIGDALRSDSA